MNEKDASAKKPYGDVKYADPGYQSDGKKRYPIDTPDHIRAAWSYINMPKNAAKYSSAQVARIKSRIKAAAGKAGIKISGESSEDILNVIETLRKEGVL